MSTSLLTIEDKLTFSSEKENDVSKEKEKTKEIQLMKDKINYVDEDEKKLKTLEEKIHPIEEKDKTKEEIKPKQENKPTIKKEEFNSTTDLCQLSNIRCKIHGNNYLNVSIINFSLVCRKCIEEGKRNFEFDCDNKENIDINKDKIDCYQHIKKKGSYYCDDCKKFICKLCFANEHRNHKSHLPKSISDNFKNYIDSTIDNVKQLKPVLDGSLEDIKQIYNKLKDQKDETLKIPNKTIQNITIKNSEQMNIFNDIFISKMGNLDKDVEDDSIRHSKIKEKNLKFLQDCDEYNKKIKNEDKSLSSVQICQYHKDKKDKFKEISEFIENSLTFLNIRMKNTLNAANESKTKLLNDIQLLNKTINTYENCTTSSIITGQANNSILLRRFLRFVHSDVKYFKITSIIVSVSSPIFLTGLALCGLYVSNKKTADPNYVHNPSSNLDITIAVYELLENEEKNKLFIMKSELLPIRDKIDPSISINFLKGIKLVPNKQYLVTIQNTSDISYCDLWVGAVSKENEKSEQKIRCHNTKVDFSFTQTKTIQTDFDEFAMGIIEGILFSKN